jgi:hypothetical protein
LPADQVPPESDGSLPELCARAFELGAADPGSVDELAERCGAPAAGRAVLTAALLGLAERFSDVVAARLVDDPRGTEPVHQMLGARLADQTATVAALRATLDDLVASGPAPVVAAAVLVLAYDTAVAAGESAALAASSTASRVAIGARRAWLADRAADGWPLRLLDEIAADLEAAAAP